MINKKKDHTNRRPARRPGPVALSDIKVANLYKSFGEKRVLAGFDAVFPAGEASCVMGESGCGKTTLLYIILGVEKPDSGEVTGVPDRVSAVFQEDRLAEDFSARTNVRITAARGTTANDIRRVLTALGLKDNIDAPVRTLSGGMKRRVAIARALLADGGLVVMDEPFKGLDDATRAEAAACVRSRLRGRTLIAVTHSASDAELLGAAQVLRM